MRSSHFRSLRATGLLAACCLSVSACQIGDVLSGNGGGKTATGATPSLSVKLVERDVEAPEVFQTKDPALWDGRPSLGGVWIAAPGVRDPERVIIRNTANGKFVIGALFKRERTAPGPPLQLSSDAAAALGILAGQPTPVEVTALRRESVPDPTAVASAPMSDAPPPAGGTAAPVGTIAATTLDGGTPAADPVTAAASAAIDRASPSAAAAPRAAPSAAAGSLSKPFVQIGIFSIEDNARNTATALRGAGILPTVLEQESAGKTFWRVVVGPSTSAADRAAVLRTVKGLGFADAYAVTN
jgi:rare lipoprotein A